MKVGVITGLWVEMRCFYPSEYSGFDIRVTGGNSSRCEVLAEELIKSGCEALLSFGISGGLNPGLEAGNILMPDIIINENGDSFYTSNIWTTKIRGVLGNSFKIINEPIIGVEKVVKTTTEKNKLYKNYLASAVDMESHRVGKIAKKHNVPFLVIRAISDTSVDSLPGSAIGVINADGKINFLSVLLKLLQKPRDFSQLYLLSRSYRIALKSLRNFIFVVSLELINLDS